MTVSLRLAPLLLATLGAAPAITLAQSAPPVAVAMAGSGYDNSFKQLGAVYPFNLRGIDSRDGVSFDIRADEIVSAAKVTLNYTYSPALLPELSQLNVLVNDEVAASIPLPKETAGTPQTRVVDIPPRLITEFNRLSIQLIGHYTMQCEDPLHSSLWAKVSNGSRLDIQVNRLDLAPDLARLPQPFFDRRDARPLELPFVIAGAADNGTLEAAGTLSSWFSALASYRGARFPSSQSALPAKGNAVVLVTSEERAKTLGLSLPAPTAARVDILVNPFDPQGQLLVISGRDANELKRAASAVALGHQTLSGQGVTIETLQALQPRKPYDAPNWLPSDRPVRLGELATPKELAVSGYAPGTVTVPLRLPPDLFLWRNQGLPLHLRYRYTPQPVATNSSLLVSFNDRFVQSIPLPSQEHLDQGLLGLIKDEELPREAEVRLPLDGEALQARLQFRFMYDYLKQGECRDVIIDNMRGTLEPDSTLDLSGYRHFIALPNLGVFKDSGFPFTRLADLSETAVILPDAPSAAEIDSYLNVLGRFGSSTGYPATAVTVARAGEVEGLADKDLLLIASGADQPLLQRWAAQLPAGFAGNSQRFEVSDLAFKVRQWFSSDNAVSLARSRAALSASGGAGTAFVAGFESPLRSGRSVVALVAARPEGLADISRALTTREDYAQGLQGSLAIVRGQQVQSLVADETYHIGSLGPLLYVRWQLARHPLLMLGLSALGVALLAGLLYAALRARARQRLER
ncbi:cellulose biosynthesis cyclic di-GMP-binding regulatory protein BcsB [Pseudomonas sp. MS15a(2019)]|uniref:cellulose biosynthesis cyclic di-GMP-binding regulatory protein BcsB n=1 Tax=Pseudomonas sp. MS15a(2019) TaxID=2579938 RepID=UPI001567A43D|nr:cellulose biosynthesis cyclic di-GMP-binding regulatory protein BcsB [Pseudomonas sp. MS15a(2019)]NRH42126.1 cellulose biosynthesis cyclic di-GMP-binding regulatory protein BcsB [Pseudomonas sp. MS15a(2019)]